MRGGADCARRVALVRPPRRFPHRNPGAGQGPDGEKRRHRARGRQGRLRAHARCRPIPTATRFMAEGTACYKIFVGALLDITDNLEGDTVLPARNGLPARRGRSLSRRGCRQGHGELFRYCQCHLHAPRLLAWRCIRLGRVRRLRPQEDGASPRAAAGRRSSAISAKSMSISRRQAFTVAGRGRHVRGRLWQRHAVVAQRSGSWRPSIIATSSSTPNPTSTAQLCRTPASVQSAPLELGGLRRRR